VLGCSKVAGTNSADEEIPKHVSAGDQLTCGELYGINRVAGANGENVIASAFCAFFSKQNTGLLGQFEIVV
jgi:hypothetical protein